MVFVIYHAKIPLCHAIVKRLSDQWCKMFHERHKNSGELKNTGKNLAVKLKYMFQFFPGK
jgi:hypothetical protein